LSDDLDLETLLETQAFFGLPSPALVEKDFHVVRALRALAALELAPQRLVFGGGTALSRAHKLVRRMSEDIDFKIVAPEPPARPALRELRERVTEALLAEGFEFEPENPEHRTSRNESRYTIFRLPYRPIAVGEGALRPEIKLEVVLWPLREASPELPVSSFIAEAFRRPPEVARLSCVSVTQTGAEKLIALTRRVAAEAELEPAERDPAVIRHVYDLHMVRGQCDAGALATLAREAMAHDAAEFGNQFPAYRDDPIGATRAALEALTRDSSYAERYRRFCQLMVYGEQPGYDEALATVRGLVADLT